MTDEKTNSKKDAYTTRSGGLSGILTAGGQQDESEVIQMQLDFDKANANDYNAALAVALYGIRGIKNSTDFKGHVVSFNKTQSLLGTDGYLDVIRKAFTGKQGTDSNKFYKAVTQTIPETITKIKDYFITEGKDNFSTLADNKINNITDKIKKNADKEKNNAVTNSVNVIISSADKNIVDVLKELTKLEVKNNEIEALSVTAQTLIDFVNGLNNISGKTKTAVTTITDIEKIIESINHAKLGIDEKQAQILASDIIILNGFLSGFEVIDENVKYPYAVIADIVNVINAINNTTFDISSKKDQMIAVVKQLNDFVTAFAVIDENTKYPYAAIMDIIRAINAINSANYAITKAKQDEMLDVIRILNTFVTSFKYVDANMIYPGAVINDILTLIKAINGMDLHIYNEADLYNIPVVLSNFVAQFKPISEESLKALQDSQNIVKLLNSITDIAVKAKTINIDDLKTLLDNLKNLQLDGISENVKSAVLDINEVVKLVDNIDDTVINVDDFSKNIKNLIKLFTDENVSIAKLIDSILAVMPKGTGEAKASLKGITDIFDIIAKLDDEKTLANPRVLERKIKYLNDVIFGDKGKFVELITNINKLPKMSDFKSAKESAYILSDFINTIAHIADIGFWDIVFMPLKIHLITNTVVDGVTDLIKALNESAEEIQEEIGDGKSAEKTDYGIIVGFINAITHLADVKAKDRRRIYTNLKFIKHFLLNDMLDIYKAIKKSADDAKGEVKDVSSITSLLEAVIKIGDLSFWKLFKLKIKAKLAAGILSSFITDIIDALPSGEDLKEGETKLNALDNFVKGVKDFYSDIPGIMKSISAQLKLGAILVLSEIVGTELIPSINRIGKISRNTNAKLVAINSVMDQLVKLTEHVKGSKALRSSINFKRIIDILDNFHSDGELITAINGLPDKGKLKEYSNKIKNAANIADSLKTICISGAILAIAGLPAILGFMLASTVVESFNKLLEVLPKDTEIKEKEKSLKEFYKLTVLCAGVMLLGGLAMKFINITDVLGFTVSLGLFMFLTIKAATMYSKEIKDAFKDIEQFAKLVAFCGLTLALGAVITKLVGGMAVLEFAVILGAFVITLTLVLNKILKGEKKELFSNAKDLALIVAACGIALALGGAITAIVGWESILGFGLILGGFVIALTLILDKLLGDKKKELFSNAKDLALIVAACGIALALGGAITAIVGWESILGFGLILGTFVIGLVLIINKGLGDKKKELFSNVKDLALLVMACGLTLALGGAITAIVGIENVVMFTAMLGLFVIGVTVPFIIWGDKIGDSMKDAAKLAILVGVAGITLMLGGAAIAALGGPLWGALVIAEFAVILGLFVYGITWAYSHNAKEIEKSFLPAVGLSIIVAISAICLIQGAKTIDKYGFMNMLLFAGTLAGFIFIVTLACKKMAKGWQDILLGALCMVAVGVIIVLMTYCIKQMARAADEVKDFGRLWAAFGSMTGMIAAVGLFAAGLGVLICGTGGVAALVLAAGAATIVGIIGIIILMAKAMVAMGDAAVAYEKAKKFDTKGAAKLINDFSKIFKDVSVVDTFFIKDKVDAMVVMATGLSKMISAIAKSVQEASTLNIPIYNGTKIVGYRKLSGGDFTKAANNTKKIITVLGGAVVDAYNKNPEVFETNFWGNSPFSKAAKSFKTLAPLISSIAHAVRNVANLTVADDYKMVDGSLKATTMRKLKSGDFKSAATNTKLIITTLGQAIIDAYNANPDVFETNFWGNSPFSKAVKSFKTLAPLISSISRAVASAAKLEIGEDYKMIKGDLKPTKIRKLNNEDFRAAAENVNHIITTLGGAIIDAYKENKDVFETNIWGNSPFSKAVKSFKTLAPLISSISRSVAYAANLEIGEDYKMIKGDLKPTKVRKLNNNDFKAASTNVQHIITTLGGAIIEAYQKNPELFETNFWGNSPFSKAVKSFKTLGPLISSISQSVSKAANLQIGYDYAKDKDGNYGPTKFRQLNNGDFQAASQNIQLIMSTLGGAIIAAYEAHPDYYDSGMFSDSPFEQTVNANIKLSKLISGISNGVKDYAQLKIPTGYDKDGKATGYRNLNDKDFNAAANNISLVISVLGKSVMEAYEKHVTWFEDGEDSPFGQACIAIGSMGTMIGNIAEGVKNYSELKFPTGYDKDGKATGYQTLSAQHFKDAANNIGLVISTMCKSLIDLYNGDAMIDGNKMSVGLKDMLADGEDSPLNSIINACVSMGEMITGIANGIQSYAQLKFATAWDEKGNPTAYQALKRTNFSEAAGNIGLVVTTLASSLLSIWNGTAEVNGQPIGEGFKEMMQNPDGEDSPLMRMIDACTSMGDMISSIAEGIQEYATLNVPEYKNGKIVGYKSLKTNDFDEASANIKKIITSIGGALIEVYNDPKNKANGLFDFKPATSSSAFFGLIASKSDATKSPFEIMISACVNLGSAIGSISKGVSNFASLLVPDPDTGKKRQMDKNDFKKAGENIGEILTILGKTIVTVYKQNTSIWSNNMGQKIVNFSMGIGKVVSILANSIKQFSNLTYTDYDESTGKKLGIKHLGNDEIKACGTTIQNVLTTIGQAFYDTYNGSPELFNDTVGGKGSQKINNVISAYRGINSVLGQLASSIQNYSMLLVPAFNESTGKYIPGKKHKLTDDEIKQAAANIGTIIAAIGKGLVDATQPNSDKYVYTVGAFNGKNSPAVNVATAISKLSGTISTIATCIGYYASGNVPLLTYDANGHKKMTMTSIGTTEMDAAGKRIGSILTAIGQAVSDTYNENTDLFEDNKIVNNVINGITGMSKAINSAAQTVLSIKKQKLDQINTSALKETIDGIFTAIGDMSDIMFKSTFVNSMESAVKKSPTIMSGIGNFSSALINVLNTINALNKKFSEKDVAEAIKGFSNAGAQDNTSKLWVTAQVIESLNGISTLIFGAPQGLGGDIADLLGGKRDMTLLDAVDNIGDIKKINNGLADFENLYDNIFNTINHISQLTASNKLTDNTFDDSLIHIINSIDNATEKLNDSDLQKNIKSLISSSANINALLTMLSNIYYSYTSMNAANITGDNIKTLISKYIPEGTTAQTFKDTSLGVFIDVMSNMPVIGFGNMGLITLLSAIYGFYANMDASKLKDDKIKTLISKYVPEGTTAQTFKDTALGVFTDVMSNLPFTLASNVTTLSTLIGNIYNAYNNIDTSKLKGDNIKALISKYVPEGTTTQTFKDTILGVFINAMSNIPSTLTSNIVSFNDTIEDISATYTNIVDVTAIGNKNKFGSLAYTITNTDKTGIYDTLSVMANMSSNMIPNITAFDNAVRDISATYDSIVDLTSIEPKNNKMFALAYTISNDKGKGVYDIMSKFTSGNLEKIKKFRTEIGLLVTNINKIQNNTNGPMDKMVKLAIEMAKIAEKFDKNGMGELAKAIGKNLTDATTYLADEVKAANETIKAAETHLAQRQKAINTAISNAKTMMAQQMTVLVKADTSNMDGTTTSTSDDTPSLTMDEAQKVAGKGKDVNIYNTDGKDGLSQNEINNITDPNIKKKLTDALTKKGTLPKNQT